MRCLVTGGAGFIGSHIAEGLVGRGDNVRILDNLSQGSLDNISHIRKDVQFIKGDLRKPPAVLRHRKSVPA